MVANEYEETNSSTSPPGPQRHRLSEERKAMVHEFVISGHRVELIMGIDDGGALREIFMKCGSFGSTMYGFMEAFAIQVSLNLQYGVPLVDMIKKHTGTRFEPNGYTGNRDIPFATSMLDYVFQYLGLKFAAG